MSATQKVSIAVGTPAAVVFAWGVAAAGVAAIVGVAVYVPGTLLVAARMVVKS